jgi:hypothetical protein
MVYVVVNYSNLYRQKTGHFLINEFHYILNVYMDLVQEV